jgi:hypothetical protein
LFGGLELINSDLEYMCEHYFNHVNYFRVDGRPVVFVHVTQKLEEGPLQSLVSTMRTAASKFGHNVFLIGDNVFRASPDDGSFSSFDAVTHFDVYGSMDSASPYAGNEAVDNYYNEQADVRARAHESGCRYVPVASPGYNDRGVRFSRNNPPLSRKLAADSMEGSLFAYQLSKAKELVDPNIHNLLVINSFNQWHEDTQIEPSVGVSTNEPYNMTLGLYYEGYGELYLDILRAGTQAVESDIVSNMLI